MNHECKYESQWERVFDNLEKQNLALNKINDNIIINNEHLAEHMRRTSLLEESLKPVRRAYDAIIWCSVVALAFISIYKILI